MKLLGDLLLPVISCIEETEVFNGKNFCKPYRIQRQHYLNEASHNFIKCDKGEPGRFDVIYRRTILQP